MNEATSVDSSCQRTFFITKERESQRPDQVRTLPVLCKNSHASQLWTINTRFI